MACRYAAMQEINSRSSIDFQFNLGKLATRYP